MAKGFSNDSHGLMILINGSRLGGVYMGETHHFSNDSHGLGVLMNQGWGYWCKLTVFAMTPMGIDGSGLWEWV